MSNNTTLTELASGAGLGIVGRFAGRFFGIAGDVIAARILGPSLFGLYAIGWTLFRLVEIMAPIGLDRAVLRFAPGYLANEDKQAFKRVVYHSVGLSLVSGLVLGAVTFGAASWMAESVFKKPELTYIFRFLAFAYPLGALLSVLSAVMRSQRSVRYAVLTQDIGQPLSALMLLGIFYLTGGKLNAVLLSDVLSYLFAVTLGTILIRRAFPFLFSSVAFNVAEMRRLLGFSIPVAFGSVFGVLIYWTDRLFVGFFQTESEVGIYQAVSQMSLLFAVILSGLGTILVPMFVSLHQRGDASGLLEAYRIGNKWGLYLGLPVLTVLFLSPQRVLLALYGEAYQDGWRQMLILLVGQAINLATGASAPLLVMGGEQRTWFSITTCAFFLGILLNLFLVPVYGTIGAAISTAVSVGALFVATLWAVRIKFGFWPYDLRYTKGLLATMFAGLVVYLTGMLPVSDLLILGVQVLSAPLAFAGLLFLLGLDTEDKVFLGVLRRKLAGFVS